jgi:tocopherol O-methyltransferase
MADPRVVEWYEKKTDFLLKKYRFGYRIHYHTGLWAPTLPAAGDVDALRYQIWRSQEDMLDRAYEAWNAERYLSGEIADIGCGLGGGPIYWAERLGTRVTAVTPVPGHVPIIREATERGEVAHLVDPVVGDAHTLEGESRFDAAVATGASNYFDRARWFDRLSRLLRPEGRVFIEDTFAGRPDMVAPFNEYWISNVGTHESYLEAARASGFHQVTCVDVTSDAAGFWRLSVAYSELLLASGQLGEAEQRERQRSIAWQRRVYEAYLDGGFRNLLLAFAR